MDCQVQKCYGGYMTTAKGAATRARIVDATVDALVRGGRAAVNLDDILTSTRTSKSQLFHYFPDGKQELIRVATQQQVHRLALEATAPMKTLEEWEQWVTGVIRLHRLQTREDACEVAALAARVLDPDPTERDVVGGSFRAWHAHLRDSLTSMRDAGVLSTDADPGALAALFATSLQGGAVIDKATGSLDYLEPALRASLAYLRRFERSSTAPASANTVEEP